MPSAKDEKRRTGQDMIVSGADGQPREPQGPPSGVLCRNTSFLRSDRSRDRMCACRLLALPDATVPTTPSIIHGAMGFIEKNQSMSGEEQFPQSLFVAGD